ncbi:hypothetical protein P886_2003 [Alteromonadaceae bacterium 2753L.S.0a.02]|nr:hypothetical protein P886_2003 [Alteromonadaceae bacterium 2753L.S.0a.02]
MECFSHTSNPAVGACRNCGKGVCRECVQMDSGYLSCSKECTESLNRIFSPIANPQESMNRVHASTAATWFVFAFMFMVAVVYQWYFEMYFSFISVLFMVSFLVLGIAARKNIKRENA